MKRLSFIEAPQNNIVTYGARKVTTYYSFGGVVLPEPPEGINGHMTLVSYGSMYAMFYGTLYGTPSSYRDEHGILACRVGEEPVAYRIDVGESDWRSAPYGVDGDASDATWLTIPQGGAFIWTSNDIYQLDDSLDFVSDTIAYQGTDAELYIPPDDGEGDTEPTTPDPTSLLMGYRVGQMIRGMRNNAVKPEYSLITLSEKFTNGDSFCSAVPVGTKVYLFGGFGYLANGLDTISVFDTETEKMRTLSTTLPHPLYAMAEAVVGTKVYLFGGTGDVDGKEDTINVFDTESEKIETLNTTLPRCAKHITAVAVGTKVYLFGGFADNGSGVTHLNTIFMFDTQTKKLTSIAYLETGICNIAAAAVGTKIYLFGGEGDGVPSRDAIYMFDTETNTISTLKTTLPQSASNIAAAAVGTKIYLFGGWVKSGHILDTINAFDTETESVTELDVKLAVPASAMGVAAVGTEVYLFSGSTYDWLDVDDPVDMHDWIQKFYGTSVK